MPRRSHRTLLLVLLAVAVFLPWLKRGDLRGSHEARVVQTARVMAAAGMPWENPRWPVEPGLDHVALERRDPNDPNDGGGPASPADSPLERLANPETPAEPPVLVNPWIVPVLGDEIRLQKPPLPYWCTAFLIPLLDDPILAGRLPSMVIGLVSTFLLVDLARRWGGRRLAFYSGLVWVSTVFVVDEFGKAMADPYLAGAVLLAVWAWVRATERPRLFLAVFYLAVALGLMIKGPVVLLHVLPAIATFSLLLPGRRGAWWMHPLGVAFVLALALPWPLAVIDRLPNAIELWRYESIGKFGQDPENLRPWWYYLGVVPTVSLPWTVVLVVGAIAGVEALRSGRRRPAAPLVWLAVVLVLFSLAGQKKAAYLLPAMPAAAMVTAMGLRRVLALARLGLRAAGGVTKPRPVVLAEAILIGHAAAGAVLAVALPAILLREAVQPWLVATLAPPLLAVAALAIAALRVERLRAWPSAMAAAFAVAVFVHVGAVRADRDNDRSPRPVGRAVATLLGSGAYWLQIDPIPPDVLVYVPPPPPEPDDRPFAIVVTDDDDTPLARLDAQDPTGRAVRLLWAERRPDADDYRIYAIDRRLVRSRPADRPHRPRRPRGG